MVSHTNMQMCTHMGVNICVHVCVSILPSCWAVQYGVVREDILPEGRWRCLTAPVSWREEDIKKEEKKLQFIDAHDLKKCSKCHTSSFVYTGHLA